MIRPSAAVLTTRSIMGLLRFSARSIARRRWGIKARLPRGRPSAYDRRSAYPDPPVREGRHRTTTGAVMSERAEIGIFGGTGLYQMEGFSDVREVAITTPFGEPSDSLVLGTLEGSGWPSCRGTGKGHRILPHELPFQANVWAMKSLGVQWILSVSAVGSLKEEYAPLEMVIPDQFLDRTRQRRSTFFGRGLVAHVGFAHPFCGGLSRVMAEACRGGGRDRPPGRHLRVHGGPAVLDPRRVGALSLLGHGHHRHDEPAGGQARARGRDLLRDAGHGHRLRLLAPGPRRGHRRADHRQPRQERGDGPRRAAGGRCAGCRFRATASARTRCATRS